MIHKTAIIDPKAKISTNVSIGAYALIGPNVEIGENTAKKMASYEVVDLFTGGDLVVETGKTTIKDSTGTVVRTGKYMSVFQKVAGKYVCIRDISNSDSKEK